MKIEVIPILTLKKHGATSTLLILDSEMYILLDCGLNQKLDFKRYDVYWKTYLDKIDLILLSHTGVEYVGALPFILQKLKHHPQIYCTPPIKNFGLFNLYDAFLNITVSHKDTYDNKNFFYDIYKCYDECQEIRFQQQKKIKLSRKQQQYELTVSCQGAGNSLGACIWTIKCNLLNIMYLVSYNHFQELHLDGIDFKQLLKSRIDVLITDSNHNEFTEPLFTSSSENRQKLKTQLYTKINKATSSDGNLIIACYPNERIIEIVFLLQEIFNENPKIFETFKVDFYRNHKQYLDQFQKQSTFMRHEAEVALQQKSKTPFLQTQIIDEDKKKIEPFLNVRKNLIPDNEDNNKIVLTTYNVLFIGPLYNYLIRNLAENPQNQLFIIGRPEQDLFEATLQLQTGFKGELSLKRGEKDIPNIKELQQYLQTCQDQDEQIQMEKDDKTDLQSIQNKIETTSSVATHLIQSSGDQAKKHLQEQQSKQSSHTIQEIQQNLLGATPTLSFQEMQQQGQKEGDQSNEEQMEKEKGTDDKMETENQHQQEQLKQQQQDDNISLLQDNKDYLEKIKLNKEVLFQTKKFPRFFQKVDTVTITEYGHDFEGGTNSKLSKHNLASLANNQDIPGQMPKRYEVSKQLYQNFVDIDFLKNQSQFQSQENNPVYFNMELSEFPLKGLSDFNSSINIIKLINPQQIILVNGNLKEQENMKTTLQTHFKQENVYTPISGSSALFELPNENIDIENFTYASADQQKQIEENKQNQQQLQQYQNQNSPQQDEEEEQKEQQILFKKVFGELSLYYFTETEKMDMSLTLFDQQQSLSLQDLLDQQKALKEQQETKKQELKLQQQQQQIQLQQQQLLSNPLMLLQKQESTILQEQQQVEQEIEELPEIDLRSNKQQQEIQDSREFFGEYRYEKLLKLFMDNQIQCSVSNHILYLYDGSMQIFKKDDQYQIKGPYSPQYFQARKILHAFLNSQQQI